MGVRAPRAFVPGKLPARSRSAHSGDTQPVYGNKKGKARVEKAVIVKGGNMDKTMISREGDADSK